jgi:hypothetical protein
MSRLDRLVRAAAAALDDFEGLLGSALGHDGEHRRRVALVATDRRLLLVGERFVGVDVTAIPYGEVTGIERKDGRTLAVTVVTGSGRHTVTDIVDEPSARVALQLVERRAAGEAAAGRPAGTPVAAAARPARVRVLA